MTFSVREFPPLELHHEAITPSGRHYRWGKDEPRPENVPGGHSHSSTMPGGFESYAVTLPRKPDVDYSDLERLTTLRALGAGGEVANEVRLESAPRVSGDEFSVGPEAKGWSAHLSDDTTAAEIYIDRDLSAWGEPSTQRRINLEASSIAPTYFSVSVGGGEKPSIIVAFTDLNSASSEEGSSWYHFGIDLGAIKYDFTGPGEDTDWLDLMAFASDDVATTEKQGTDHNAKTATGQTLEAPSSGYPYVFLSTRYSGAGKAETYVSQHRWSNIRVFGNHGLTKRGEGSEEGLYASDVIAHAISRWAPLLRYSTGSTGTILPTSLAIPHLAFRDRTTAQAIVDGANAFELRNYAVWEDRTFHYHQWGDRGRRWRARVAPAQLSETGPTVDRLRNGVVVTWRDPDGSTRSVGPIGSGCEAEDERLEDSDPENPANQMGVKLYGNPVQLGVSVESVAIEVGELNLLRFQETDTSGEARIVGTCTDDKGIEWPAWKVRAGDTISFIDASDTRERRIIRSSYSENDFTNTITLDAPPEGTPDLLAQLDASIVDLGL